MLLHDTDLFFFCGMAAVGCLTIQNENQSDQDAADLVLLSFRQIHSKSNT